MSADASPDDPDFLQRTVEASPAAQSDRSALQPGMVLTKRYRLSRYVARGGMGEVWEAEDLTLHETVALKTIRPDRDSAETLQRLQSEVKLARRIGHPNVCRVFEFGQHEAPAGPIAFLTMEFLRGVPLSDWTAEHGPFAPGEALALLRQLAAALDAAHAQGVIHRDFKSQNVFVERTADGLRAVVTDFGLARALDASQRITADSHAMMGTPAYMAPEQVSGEAVGPAADRFALGVVAFELVTGQLPFKGATPFEMAMARLTAAPIRPSLLVKSLPRQWDDALAVAMAKDPDTRFASAAGLVAALEGTAPVPGPSKRRRWPLVGAALALTALVAGGGLAWRHTQPVRWRDLSTLNATNEAARRRFQDAMVAQSTRSGDAEAMLVEALALDPGFAEAHLQLLFVRLIVKGRDYEASLRAAMSARARLSPRDRDFLDALEALARTPRSFDEALRRAERLTERYPRDAQVWDLLGALRRIAGDDRGMAAAMGRERQLDPSSTSGLQAEALVLLGDGATSEAEARLRDCLEKNPSHLACLSVSVELNAALGRCSEVDALTQRLLKLRPDQASFALWHRLQALSGTGAEPAAIEALFAETRQLPAAEQPFFDVFLASAKGDLGALAALSDGPEGGTGRTTALLELLFERGDTERAAALAADTLARRAGTPATRGYDHDDTPLLLSTLRLTGRLTPEAHRAQRQAWLDGWKSKLGAATWRSEGALVWLQAFASPVVAPELAKEALDALPATGVTLPSLERLAVRAIDRRVPWLDWLARIQLGGGQLADARATLSRLTQQCTAHLSPAPLHDLGVVHERLQETAAACSTFAAAQRFGERLGWAPVSSTRAAERARALRCSR